MWESVKVLLRLLAMAGIIILAIVVAQKCIFVDLEPVPIEPEKVEWQSPEG